MGSHALSLLLALVAVAVVAKQATWVGTEPAHQGHWDTAINWQPPAVPTAEDDVLITVEGDYDVEITENAFAQTIVLGTGEVATQPTISIETNKFLNISGPANSNFASNSIVDIGIDALLTGAGPIITAGEFRLRGTLEGTVTTTSSLNCSGQFFTFDNQHASITKRNVFLTGEGVTTLKGSVGLQNVFFEAGKNRVLEVAGSLEAKQSVIRSGKEFNVGIEDNAKAVFIDSGLKLLENSGLDLMAEKSALLEFQNGAGLEATDANIQISTGATLRFSQSNLEVIGTSTLSIRGAQTAPKQTQLLALPVGNIKPLISFQDASTLTCEHATINYNGSDIVYGGTGAFENKAGCQMTVINSELKLEGSTSFTLDSASELTLAGSTLSQSKDTTFTCNGPINAVKSSFSLVGTVAFNGNAAHHIFAESEFIVGSTSATFDGTVSIASSNFTVDIGKTEFAATSTLAFEKSNIITKDTADLSIQGDLTIQGGTILAQQRSTLNVGKVFTWDKAELEVSGTAAVNLVGVHLTEPKISITGGSVKNAATGASSVFSNGFITLESGLLHLTGTNQLSNTVITQTGGDVIVDGDLKTELGTKLSLADGNWTISGSTLNADQFELNIHSGTFVVQSTDAHYSQSTFTVDAGTLKMETAYNMLDSRINVNGGGFSSSGPSQFSNSALDVNLGSTMVFDQGQAVFFATSTLKIADGRLGLIQSTLEIGKNSIMQLESQGSLSIEDGSILAIGSKLEVEGNLLLESGCQINSTDSIVFFGSSLTQLVLEKENSKPLIVATGEISLSGKLEIELTGAEWTKGDEITLFSSDTSLIGTFSEDDLVITHKKYCAQSTLKGKNYAITLTKCKGLSAGAIVGIVIAILVLIALVPLYWFVVRPKLQRRKQYAQIRADGDALDGGL